MKGACRRTLAAAAIILVAGGAVAIFLVDFGLHDKGRVEVAIACWRKAIALDPKYAKAHHSLGVALQGKGQLDEAIACFKKAIALDPKHAAARTGLARAERLAARDKLPAFQNGSYTPASNAERLGLAGWCQIEKLNHTATRLYAAAFAADPKLADDLEAGHRYNAACYAALAAAGPRPSSTTRTRPGSANRPSTGSAPTWPCAPGNWRAADPPTVRRRNRRCGTGNRTATWPACATRRRWPSCSPRNARPTRGCGPTWRRS